MQELKTVQGGPQDVRVTRHGVAHVEAGKIVLSDNARRQIEAMARLTKDRNRQHSK